jgi:hypothetical protein
MSFHFDHHGVVSAPAIKSLFPRECLRNGVFTNGDFLPTYAHDAEAVERTEHAFDRAMSAIAGLVDAGGSAAAQAVRAGFADSGGTPSQHGPPAGSLDLIAEQGRSLRVEGWMLAPTAANVIELVSEEGGTVRAERIVRPDLRTAFPDVEGAEKGGFSAMLPARTFERDGDFSFTLRARIGDAEVFSCKVLRPSRGPGGSGIRFADGVLYL